MCTSDGVADFVGRGTRPDRCSWAINADGTDLFAFWERCNWAVYQQTSEAGLVSPRMQSAAASQTKNYQKKLLAWSPRNSTFTPCSYGESQARAVKNEQSVHSEVTFFFSQRPYKIHPDAGPTEPTKLSPTN